MRWYVRIPWPVLLVACPFILLGYIIKGIVLVIAAMIRASVRASDNRIARKIERESGSQYNMLGRR